MKPVFILPAILLILFLPLAAYGGTIRTSITSTHTVTDQGDIQFDVTIRNNGDVTAHNVALSLIMADLVKTYDALGDNPAGGEIRLKETLVASSLRPGKYTAVMRVDFEEQSGKPHHAYHFFQIPYGRKQMQASPLPLSLKTADPCFNRKALWARNSSITLSIQYNGEDEIGLNVLLFLPDGFTSSEPNQRCRLRPKETRVLEIPLRLEPSGKNYLPYHLIAWCDHHETHDSWDLKGIIKVEERPVYFKGYLISATILLVILFAALAIRNRHNSRRRLAKDI